MLGISPVAYWRRRLGNWLAGRLLTEEQQLARSLRNIRADCAALGFWLGDLSDEEIIVGVRRMGEALRAASPTAAEWVAFGARMRAIGSVEGPSAKAPSPS